MIFIAMIVAAAGLLVFSLLLVKRQVYDTIVFVTMASLSFNLTGFDVAHLAVPFLLASGVIYGHLRAPRRGYPATVMTLVALLATWVVLANVLSNPSPPAAAHVVANVLLFTFIQLYLVSEQRTRVIFAGLMTGMFAAAILSTLVRRALLTLPDLFFDAARDPRFMGMMGDPNMVSFLGMFLALWLIDEIIRPKVWPRRRLLKLLLLLVALFEIVASLSRSAWVGLAVSLAAYAFVLMLKGYFHSLMRMSFYVTIAGIVALVAIVWLGYGERLLTRLSYKETVARDAEEDQRAKFFYTRRALSVMKDAPITGVGTGRTEKHPATHSLGAHNTYVQVLTDTGPLAFVLFVTIILIVGAAATARAFTPRSISHYGISAEMVFATLSGLAAAAMFHDVVFWPTVWLPVSLGVATIWPARRRVHPVHSPAPRLQPLEATSS